MRALRPSRSRLMMVWVTSPATLNVSLPRPPTIVVTNPCRVPWMKKSSSPSRPSTSTASTPVNRTLSPAPNTPSSVMTKLSFSSVPSTTTLSKPGPPSTSTGALMLYWIVSSPSPAMAAVQGRDGAVVVGGEVVVAGAALHDQAAIDVLVVVDPFDVLPHLIAHVLERSVQQGDERRRVRRRGRRDALQQCRGPAQEEDVRGVAAVDRQDVGAIVGRPAVEDVHDVVVGAGRVAAPGVDHVVVRAGAAVEIDAVTHQGGGSVVEAVAEEHQGRQAVHDEQVLPRLAEHPGVARERQRRIVRAARIH